MAASKLPTVSIVALLLLVGVAAAAGIEEEITEPCAAAADSTLRLKLDQLRSKISSLESSISGRIRELESKGEGAAQLDKILQEKSASIASLQSEIESHAEELVGKTHARAAELENRVERLRDEIETKSRKRGALEARAIEAEKKLHELNSNLQNLRKTNDEQKHIIRKTESALKVAEEELMRAQLDSTSKIKDLTEIHGAWIPRWLVAHINYCQDLVATNWNKHARSSLDAFLQKAYEKSTQAQKWVGPQYETAKTKWVPALKEQWMIFTMNVRPYVKMLSMKTIKFYGESKSTVSPHFARVQGLADPYFQEVKKFSELYIDQVAIFMKPHIDKVRVSLKPCTKHVVRTYLKFLKLTRIYHRQVQATIMEKLKKHELTKPFATKELAWFMASALLVYPIFFLYRVISAIFWPVLPYMQTVAHLHLFSKKSRKLTRNVHANHGSRRHKRKNAEK